MPLQFNHLINNNEPRLGRQPIDHAVLSRTTQSTAAKGYHCKVQFPINQEVMTAHIRYLLDFDLHQLFMNELSMLDNYPLLLQNTDVISERWSADYETKALDESAYLHYFSTRIQPTIDAAFHIVHQTTGIKLFVSNNEKTYNRNKTGILGSNKPDTMTREAS